MKSFWQRKPLPATNLGGSSESLQRTITLPALLLMGVGSTLGTGIFFVLTESAPIAGPAVIVSFILAAFAAGLTALCYAEVASAIPVTGSSYTFTYITMGQGLAMFVGACLILEWGVAAAAVAVGWSNYLNEALRLTLHIEIPESLRGSRLQLTHPGQVTHYGNIPAMAMIWLCAILLLRGSSQSTWINAFLTLCKIIILSLFVAMVIPAFDSSNLLPFAPHGFSGMSQAAAIVFFSFVGLDSVVNANEEAINPDRNIPRAIMGALAVVTIIYLLVAVTSLGAQRSELFAGQSAGLAEVLQKVSSSQLNAIILTVGAVISIMSVTLMALYGQARICYAMSRDGILPSRLARLHPRNGTPSAATIAAALLVTPLAGFVPSSLLWGMVSIGTLMAFIAVAFALILLRQRYPELNRNGFKVPLYPLTPILSIACCIYLIASLGSEVHLAFAAWICLAMCCYFAATWLKSHLDSQDGTTVTR